LAKQLTNHQWTNDLALFFIYKKLFYIDLKIISLILQQQQQQKIYVGFVPNMQLGANCVSQTQMSQVLLSGEPQKCEQDW
jgi:hypothetical protein